MSIFQCLDETTGLLMSTCQYHHCDKDESGAVDNCDVPPPYLPDETNPPIIVTEPVDPINSFKCLKDVSHIEIRQGDLEIIHQRIGGEDVILHHFILENKAGEKEEVNIDFSGTVQLWSGGVLHFNLTNEAGEHISFTEDAKGNVTDYKCNKKS